MDQKTYDVGMKMRRQVAGNEYVDKAMANVDDFNRDFQRIVTQYCWGEAWGDDTLPPRERSILNLGMIASLGRKPVEYEEYTFIRAQPPHRPSGAARGWVR